MTYAIGQPCKQRSTNDWIHLCPHQVIQSVV